MRIANALAGSLFIVVAVGMAPPTAHSAAKAPAPAQDPAAGPYHVVKTFDVGGEGSWDYVAVDPDAHRLYVPRSTRVIVLDSETGAQIGEIADTAGVHGVALAPGLNKGFTSNGRANTCTVFDLKTLKTLNTIKTGTNPDAITYEPTTKRIFAFNGRSNDATVINAEDLSVAGTIPLGGKPEFSVIDGQGKIFVNIEDTSELVRIDAKSMKVEQRFPLSPGEGPSGLAIDPAHHRLFSVCSNEHMIVIDGESGKVLASPAIGRGTDGAAFDAAGGFAFSSNGEGTMTVVATGDGPKQFTVAQTLKTLPRARTMVIDPKTHRIYMPTAEFEAAPATAPAAGGAGAAASQPQGGRQGGGRPTMKPGSFKIVVIEPSR